MLRRQWTEAAYNFVEQELFGISYEKQKVGLELELLGFAFRENDSLKPLNLIKKQVFDIDSLSDVFPSHNIHRKEYRLESTSEPGFLIDVVHLMTGDQLRFEPGGQLELITAPCSHFSEAMTRMTAMQSAVKQIATPQGVKFIQHGINPWFEPEEIGLQLPFSRYRALWNYYERLGPLGHRMMLQTASMHINLDFGRDFDHQFMRMWASNLLTPFVSAMFANSPLCGRKSTPYASYRNYIWQKMDPLRSGFLLLPKKGKTWNRQKLISAYYDSLMLAPFINPEVVADPSQPYPPFEQLMNQPPASVDDLLQNLSLHASLHFPCIRPRNYLEIRLIDAPPEEWQWIPPLFFIGLLYNDQQLEAVIEALAPFQEKLPSCFAQSLYGLSSEFIYDHCLRLFEMAIEGCEALCPEFIHLKQIEELLNFKSNYLDKRRTFADDFKENPSFNRFFSN
jgi:glutamate--cysteine ligase